MTRRDGVEGLRFQADWCQRLGSPLYHGLLERIIADVEQDGVSGRILGAHLATDGGRDPRQLPLLLLGAVHRLVLEGRAPELAPFYGQAATRHDPDPTWDAFLVTLRRHEAQLTDTLPPSIQTNETARCCALLPGFYEIAHCTRLPLHLREIGTSAGLNLRWDRYRYETPAGVRGDPASAVTFEDAPPVPDLAPIVASRRGCDLNPVDPCTEVGRLTLLSFLWPGQAQRFERLSAAIEIASRVPAEVQQADAVLWLERELAARPRDGVTVVFHSVVWPYFSGAARDRIAALLESAGAAATASTPLAWLSMEAGGAEAEVRLTLWPGGERRRIATCGFHGRDVRIAGG